MIKELRGVFFILVFLLLSCSMQSPMTQSLSQEFVPTVRQEDYDEVTLLLENLKQETMISFFPIQTVTFIWFIGKGINVEEVMISGKEIKAQAVSSESYDMIDLFFKEEGFQIDQYNVAAGTISGATGYQHEQMVCSVTGRLSGFEEEKEEILDSDQQDISVQCGYIV